MKILVADDERMVRRALVCMIEELQPGVNDIIEVKNGGQLKETAPEFKPDIAFVDISMPVCTGLEAIADCRERTPDTLWVILTCFAEFAYAQEAIKAGVSNYLLKPIDTEQLEKVLGDAREQLQQRYGRAMENFSSACIKLYNDCQFGTPRELTVEGLSEPLFALALTADNKNDASHATLGELMSMLRARVDKLSLGGALHASFFSATGEICIIACQSAGERLRALAGSICALSSQQQTFSAVYRNKMPDIQAACAAVDGLCALTRFRCLKGFGEALEYAGLERLSQDEDCKKLCELAEALSLSYAQHKKAEYLRNAAKLEECEATQLYSEPLRRYMALAIDLPAGGKTLAEAVKAHADAIFSGAVKPDTDISGRVCAFVDKNYAADIGINTIADNLGLTPNYLSSVFRQQTGMRFTDYLTRVRIDNARRLLIERPELSVKDVAEMVGYFSQRHFTKLFQSEAGCNPSQYGKQRPDINRRK